MIKVEKALVALSGGVDSSVAAYLLKEQGYQVVGVFMRLADLENFKAAEKRANKTAKILGIPFFVLDLRKQFKKQIIDYFIKEYKAGRTPNPCVACNKAIKFEFLMKACLPAGREANPDAQRGRGSDGKRRRRRFDFVATGHYSRLRREIQNPKSEVQKHRYKLLKGRDEDKDQSYFLYRLAQKDLRKIIFPLGNLKKQEVTALAKKLKLPTAKIKESQEVCFIKGKTEDFLRKHIKAKAGDVVDVKRKILGKHKGLIFYTIGQRKGIGLAGGPYFVIKKDQKNNKLVVSKNQRDLLKKEAIIKEVNWINKPAKFPAKVQAKIRYRSPAVSAIISQKLNPKRYTLTFSTPQRAVTPGQSAVFYAPVRSRKAKEGRKDQLLGGGIIC